MTIGEATQRYLDEVAVDADTDHARQTQELHMAELRRFFGEGTLLCSITPDDVAKAASARARTPLTRLKRLGSFVRKRDRKSEQQVAYSWRETDRLPTPATVNRQLIEPLRRVLRRAKKVWKVPVDLDQFQWGGRDGVKRQEPEGRSRELSAAEEAAFWTALDADYRDLAELFIISGKRQSIWLDLEKSKVDIEGGTITYRLLKKRRAEIRVSELTDREREIVKQAFDESPEDCHFVFTAISKSPRDRKARRKVSPRMFREAVAAACEKARVADFRPHDFRHTFGSRLIRATRDLRLTQEAMEHSSIASTLRYTHVLQEDVKKARASVTVLRRPDNDSAVRPNTDAVPKLDRTSTG